LYQNQPRKAICRSILRWEYPDRLPLAALHLCEDLLPRGGLLSDLTIAKV
jgi:hypothetical protein